MLQGGGKADGKGGGGGVGVQGGEHLPHSGGGIGQLATLHRLHHHHRLVVGHRHLVAAAGLHLGVLPVQIVDLKLDEVHLRVLGEHLLQQLGGAVEGEARLTDVPFRLLLLDKGEAVQPLGDLVVLVVDAVEQIVVEKLHAAALELELEHVGLLLGGGLFQLGQGQLGGQGEGVPGVPLHQAAVHRLLTGASVVEVGGVKVGKAPLQKQVHHLAHLGEVDGSVVLGIQKGEAHTAKTKFFHG